MSSSLHASEVSQELDTDPAVLSDRLAPFVAEDSSGEAVVFWSSMSHPLMDGDVSAVFGGPLFFLHPDRNSEVVPDSLVRIGGSSDEFMSFAFAASNQPATVSFEPGFEGSGSEGSGSARYEEVLIDDGLRQLWLDPDLAAWTVRVDRSREPEGLLVKLSARHGLLSADDYAELLAAADSRPGRFDFEPVWSTDLVSRALSAWALRFCGLKVRFVFVSDPWAKPLWLVQLEEALEEFRAFLGEPPSGS